MRREVHVRFCERLGVRLPGPTLLIVFHESSLRRILASYLDYYHRSRTHLSLGKDSPEPRGIQPPEMGSVVVLPQVGGLHHRYERRAAA
jgi:putative transposase